MSIAATHAVRAVIEQYVEGSRTGNAALLESIFHPEAVMFGHMAGKLLTGGPQPFFDMVKGQPSPASSGADYRAEISAIRVDGDTATATLLEEGFHGMAFVDHFHLVCEDDQWRISSKLFHRK